MLQKLYLLINFMAFMIENKDFKYENETNNKQLVVDVNYQLNSRERKSVSVLPVCKVCERINTPPLSRTALPLM